MAQVVKNLLAVQETWVQFLAQEDPLEQGMATHSRTLAWRIPWREEAGELQFMRSQRVREDWVTNTYTHNTASPPEFLSETMHCPSSKTIFGWLFNYLLDKTQPIHHLNMTLPFNKLSVENKAIQYGDKVTNKCDYIVTYNGLKENGLE